MSAAGIGEARPAPLDTAFGQNREGTPGESEEAMGYTGFGFGSMFSMMPKPATLLTVEGERRGLTSPSARRHGFARQ